MCTLDTDQALYQQQQSQCWLHCFVLFTLQVLVEYNDLAGLSVILGLLVLTTLGTMLLPIETKGKSLSVCSQ